MSDKTILDTINEIDNKHQIGWDIDSTLTILARFIAEKCKIEEFAEFVEQTAQSDLELLHETWQD